jgi:hypothetical protein
MGLGGEAASVRLDEQAPAQATLGELARKMAAWIDAGALPKPDDERLFLVYLPRDTTISEVKDACAPFGTRAIHTTFAWPRDARVATRPVAFMLRCGDDLGELTATASHEVLEAASDPTLDGFQLERTPRARPFSAYGVEAVDVCKLITLDDHRASVEGWLVQRAWSNAEARAGRDPCVPHRAHDPYVAVIPKEPVVSLSRATGSGVVQLNAISERVVPAWSVAAFELSTLRGAPACFALELDRHAATNGSTLSLTIRLVQSPCSAGPILLVSTLGTRSHAWPLLVELR